MFGDGMKHTGPEVCYPAMAAGIGQFAVIQSVAPSVGLDVSPVNVRDASEIGHSITNFVRLPNGGIVTAGALDTISWISFVAQRTT
jgi:hypothetical protein